MKQKQQGATKISSHNCVTILSHHCRTNSTFRTKTARCDQDLVPNLCDHIFETTRLLKQKQNCAIMLSHKFFLRNQNSINYAIGASRISLQNCLTILSDQFIWNKNRSVRSCRHTNSTFKKRTSKKRDLKLVRPYCRTSSTFETKTARCDQDLVPKLCDNIVIPIRLLKQKQ